MNHVTRIAIEYIRYQPALLLKAQDLFERCLERHSARPPEHRAGEALRDHFANGAALARGAASPTNKTLCRELHFLDRLLDAALADVDWTAVILSVLP